MHVPESMKTVRATRVAPTRAMEAIPARAVAPTFRVQAQAGTWLRAGILPRAPRQLCFVLLFGGLASAVFASLAASVSSAQNASPLSVPARNWAVDCAKTEILVIQHPNSYLRYRFHEVNEKGDQVRDQIETPEGTVARLIQRDGKPLTTDEDATERERLNALVSSPSTFYRHIKGEQANKKLGIDLLNLMPDAMLWSYAPGQPQLPNQDAGSAPLAPPLVVLDFKPNPQWSPPDIPAEPLTGLEGRLWIDPRSHNIVHLEGDLFHAINIGWGMVVHIYPGGTVTVDQTNVAGQRWIVDHIVEQLALRALMIKTVKQHLVFDSMSFQAVQPMSYQQAIKILLDTPLPH
jgi:hypothetical protein